MLDPQREKAIHVIMGLAANMSQQVEARCGHEECGSRIFNLGVDALITLGVPLTEILSASLTSAHLEMRDEDEEIAKTLFDALNLLKNINLEK